MFRDSITKLSLRKKLLLLALVAVLLPIMLLTYVQYRSLVELENKTRGAFKENLRQTLLNVEIQVEEKFEAIASRSLMPLGNIKLSPGKSAEQFEKHFSGIKQSNPEIERFFVFSSCGCEKEKDSFAYIYSSSFLKLEHTDLKNNAEAHRVLNSFDKSRTAQNFLDESRKVLFWRHNCSECPVEAIKRQETYLFYPLTDVSDGRQIGFAGLVLNENYIREELFARSIAEVLNSPNLAIPNSDVAISISDETGRQIYTNSSAKHEYIAQTAFSRPFSNWQAGIGFKNTNLDSLARNSFWQSLAVTFLVLAFLLLGIVMTIRAADREVRLAQAKSVFVSNVSHELKTPLSLIALFAEILELGRVKNNAKKREYYRIIGDESRRLSKLIDNILDFSKIEAGRRTYNFASADIGEVIENVLSAYRYQITNSGFLLKTNTENNLPPVLIDRDAIAQAVLNLLDNAVKYSPAAKEISVTVKMRDSSLMIEVADCGTGIPRAEQAKIFEKFYRVGNGLVHDVKGSGLGLSLVRHIVEAHKGKITLESEVGKGSRFIIHLPLAAKTANQQSQNTQAGEVYKVAENINH